MQYCLLYVTAQLHCVAIEKCSTAMKSNLIIKFQLVLNVFWLCVLLGLHNTSVG